MLRLRKKTLKAVKELDAFPKIPETYQETSPARGGVSILTFGVILVLVVSEVFYYTNTDLKYQYEVDKIFDGKLKINVDMTVAMKCEYIGADILDLTGQRADTFGELTEEPAYFELSPNQKRYQDMIYHMNNYIRNEYHAVHEFMWKSAFKSLSHQMPEREDKPDYPPDGCRLVGSLEVNKVAGNFHVTAGKSLPLMGSHMHLAMVDSDKYNFSHRINHFSYGDPTAGVVNPLDGDERIIKENFHIFQYFVQVVPTKVKTKLANLDTYQYSVTERNRSINHSKGSHGVPGIFFKYDLSSFKVLVTEEHKPYSQFLIRMCGIIGGIFATSGMLHSLVGFIVDLVCCRYKLGKYKPKDTSGDNDLKISSLDGNLSDNFIPGVNFVAQNSDKTQNILNDNSQTVYSNQNLFQN